MSLLSGRLGLGSHDGNVSCVSTLGREWECLAGKIG